MADLAAIRAGLAARLATIEGLQQSAYVLAQPTPPAVEVMPGPIDYDLAMGRGLDRRNFTVRAFVGLTGDIGAQKLLDKLLAKDGPQSIKAAIESDPTLGGVVDDLHVRRNTGYRVFVKGSDQVLGSEWEIEVLESD